MTHRALVVLAGAAALLASCSSGEEAQAVVEVGQDQRDLASWALDAAADLRAQESSFDRCVVIARVAPEFFERAAPATLDGAAQPGRVWSVASELGLAINEGDTFCTWTVPDDGLIRGSATSMAAGLEALAEGLTTSP